MGLDNIPHEYPCVKAGTVVRTPEERIDCDATIAAGGCPWKVASAERGEPVYGIMGTYCWYRGKVGTWMLGELQNAGHYPPSALEQGFYGDDEAKPNLSPEYCVALGEWMMDHAETYASLHRHDDDQGKDAINAYRYAAWWLKFVGEHADGADAWW